MSMRAMGTGVLSGLLLAGCNKPPQPQPVQKAEESQASADAKAEEATPSPPPLSEEDIRLIEADPATLTEEERRKRAYALRRKIMQNPDSPAARTLTDLAKAAKEGQIDPSGDKGPGVTLSLPGTKPKGSAPPAGVRPEDVDEASNASNADPAPQ